MNQKFKQKSALILLGGALLFSVIGCNKNNGPYTGKIIAKYGEACLTQQTTVSSTTYDAFVDRINLKEDFAIIISNSHCGCWLTEFQPIVAKANYVYELGLKHIDYSIFEGKEKYGLVTTSSLMPSIALFHEGVLCRQVCKDPNAFNDMFVNENKFFDFLEETIVMPKVFKISKDDLDYKIAEEGTFNLYIGRSECPDCQRIENLSLYPWVNANTQPIVEPLYLFDIQEYYEKSPEQGGDPDKYAAYCAIKDQYGLSQTEVNPVLGYSTGMVPTFQRRTGSTITDMCVVLNDSPDVTNHVIESYYTAERVAAMPFLAGTGSQYILNGKEYTGTIMEWYTTSYQYDLHKPIFDRWISYYVK